MRPPAPILGTMERHEASLYRHLGWALVLFTVFAFARKLVVMPGRVDRYVPLVRLHGAAMLAWLVLITLQAELGARVAMRLHKTPSVLSAAPIAVTVWTGFLVTRAFSGEIDRIEVFLSNLVHLTALGGFWGTGVAAAVLHRVYSHRRMMFFAALAVMSPPISRVTQTIGLPNGAAAAAHFALVLALPILFDVATRERPHRATVAGLAVVTLPGVAAALAGMPAYRNTSGSTDRATLLRRRKVSPQRFRATALEKVHRTFLSPPGAVPHSHSSAPFFHS